MEPRSLDNTLALVREALERDDVTRAVGILEAMRGPDQAEIFSELDDRAQRTLLPRLDPAEVADILEELDDEQAVEIAAVLEPDRLISIVDEMEPDEAADLLGDLPQDKAQTILAGLEDPDEIHPLLLHPDETAGGLMTSEFLALRRRMTAGEALQAMRNWKPEVDAINLLFVVDAQGKLCGVVSLRRLIIADAVTPIADLMDPEVVSVPAGADQEDCARLMQRYNLLALPVVDADRRLLGVVTIDDVVDVLVDEATEDIQRLGGAQPLGRSYLETGVLTVVRKRVGWLMLLFVTESLTGTVLRHFEDELATVVALSFFVPLLIGTGGNAGSQTTSTIIRALAVGDIDLRDALRSLWHELRIGLLLGLVMAVIAFFRSETWGSTPTLSATVALAIFTIVIWANGLGSLLPLAATALHIDPTVVSGPVMSTLVDATGLFIYFSIARVIMGL
jgi:magnesium transporter